MSNRYTTNLQCLISLVQCISFIIEYICKHKHHSIFISYWEYNLYLCMMEYNSGIYMYLISYNDNSVSCIIASYMHMVALEPSHQIGCNEFFCGKRSNMVVIGMKVWMSEYLDECNCAERFTHVNVQLCAECAWQNKSSYS